MNVVASLTNVYLKFNRKVLFDAKSVKKHRDMKDQKEYLSQFRTPKDEYEKAYFKYKCHAYYHYPFRVRLIYNIAAIIMIPLFMILNAIKGKEKNNIFDPIDAIIVVSPTMGYKDIFPEQIGDKYPNMKEVKPLGINDRSMDKKAWEIYRKCMLRYWMHPYFCFEVLIRISNNCKLMKKYNPKAIIGYGWERDFVAPILLHYCNSKGVERLSFMHGIFVYSIDKAFISFNKYYVWEPYFYNMFTCLRADVACLEVYKPKKYEPIVKPRQTGEEYDFFLTYYFTAESNERMLRIKQCLDLLENQGLMCKLRPHPRFTDKNMLNDIFSNYLIEDSSWSLETSMECSKYIAAYNSTVLTEAYYSGKDIVIDDYVDPSKFQNMKERHYIMLSRPHILMTELIREKCNTEIV